MDQLVWKYEHGEVILQWLSTATDDNMFNVYFKSISILDLHSEVFKNIFIWIETVVHIRQQSLLENAIIWITTSFTGVGQTLQFQGSWIWPFFLPTTHTVLLIKAIFTNVVFVLAVSDFIPNIRNIKVIHKFEMFWKITHTENVHSLGLFHFSFLGPNCSLTSWKLIHKCLMRSRSLENCMDRQGALVI